MRMDLHQFRYASYAELRTYMRGSPRSSAADAARDRGRTEGAEPYAAALGERSN